MDQKGKDFIRRIELATAVVLAVGLLAVAAFDPILAFGLAAFLLIIVRFLVRPIKSQEKKTMNRKVILNILHALGVLALAVLIGGVIVFAVKAVMNSVVLEKYEEKAPVWVTDERLVGDALDNYFSWADAEGTWVDSKVVIYPTHGEWLRKKYYSCSAVLRYTDGKFILQYQSNPFEASEECFRWAVKLTFRVYRGMITVEGDQKVIQMERDRTFQPEIVLVRPAE